MTQSDTEAIYQCSRCFTDEEIVIFLGANGPYCVECACEIIGIDNHDIALAKWLGW